MVVYLMKIELFKSFKSVEIFILAEGQMKRNNFDDRTILKREEKIFGSLSSCKLLDTIFFVDLL